MAGLTAQGERARQRSFARLFAALLLVAAVWLAWLGHWWGLLLLAPAIGLLVAGWRRPALLARPTAAWFALGHGLQVLVSPLVLAAIFLLVLTPTALLLRLSGADPLRLRRREQESYWRARDAPGPAGESLRRQF